MSDRSRLPHGVRRAFRLLLPGRARDEVDEELAFHLEERTRQLAASGMEPRAARREAERRFGDLGAIRARCRALAERKERSVRLRDRAEQLARDLVTAAQGLARRPGFTAAAVATLALGLGANAAVFRAVEAVALRPLPFPQPDRLVSVSGTVDRGEVELRAASYPESRDWRRGVRPFEHLAALAGRTLTLTAPGTKALALLGGAAGVAVAAWSRDLLAAWRPEGLPAYAASEAASPVVWYLLALTAATALLLSAIPLAAVLRRDPAKGLTGGRGAGDGQPGHRGATRLRRLLVAAEVAVAVVVLVGAGLLVRSFRAQAAIDSGFDAERLVAASVRLPEGRYDDDAARGFAERLAKRLAALPGARSAALGSDIPLVSGYNATYVRAAERYAENPEHRIRVYFHRVTPGFFATTGIRLLAGRSFGPVPADADPAVSGEEVVVSRRLAEAAWPGESALGKRLLLGHRAPYTVVGVVEPVRYRVLTPDPANPEDPDLYLPLAGNPPGVMALFVETRPNVEIPASALRAAVAELDPALALSDAGPLAEAVRRETAVARFSATLFGLFGLLAAILAVVGVYGVMAYSVTRRRRELGVRMALGAARPRILRLVLGEGALVAAGGVAAGLAAALALSRLMAESLYGTEPADPATYAAVAAGLTATVLAASWLPARRAAGTEPVHALEAE